MSEAIMPIRNRIKVLLAERNLVRARTGERSISVREISRTTGITHSALVKLVNNQSKRIDFETIDRLMRFFNTNDLRDILEYSRAAE